MRPEGADILVNETASPNPIFTSDSEGKIAVGQPQRIPNLCER